MDESAFYRQVARAKSQSVGLAGAVRRNDYDGVLNYTRSQNFNNIADRAYNHPKGYAIGYVGNQKVMYVSGSRNIYDWGFNVVGGVLPTKMHVMSNRTSKNLSDIARKENVDVVVGHSRGAKIVSGMRGNFTKFGLDGAMMLADKRDAGMMNIGQKQPLDRFIGYGGRNNKYYRVKRPGYSHFISRDYKGYKQRYQRKPRFADNFVRPFFNPWS